MNATHTKFTLSQRFRLLSLLSGLLLPGLLLSGLLLSGLLLGGTLLTGCQEPTTFSLSQQPQPPLETAAPPASVQSAAPASRVSTSFSPLPAPQERLLEQWRRTARPERPLLLSRHPDGRPRAVTGLTLPLSSWQATSEPEQWLPEALSHLEGMLGTSTRDQLQVLHYEQQPGQRWHLKLEQQRAGLPVAGARLHLHGVGTTLTSLESSLVPIRTERSGSVESLSRLLAQLRQRERLELGEPTPQPLWWVKEAQAERAWKLVGVPDPQSLRGAEWLVLSALDGRVLERSPLLETHQSLQAPSLQAPSRIATCTSETELGCQAVASGQGDDRRIYKFFVYRGNDFPPPLLVDGYLHPLEGAAYPNIYGSGDASSSYFVDLSESDTRGGIYIFQSDGNIANPADFIFYDAADFIANGPGLDFSDGAVYGESVSALHGIRAALDYYDVRHGRKGLAHPGQTPVDIISRVGLKGLNAAWASGYNYMLFGSYHDTTLAVSVDVTGHELTHGVLSFSTQLGNTYQTGALNEGLADIFGVAVEAYATSQLDWRIAEDIPGIPALRNLKRPGLYNMPEHMSQYVTTDGDRGGVHTNMSIPTKAFQLAVEGSEGAAYYGYVVTPADSSPLRSLELVMAPIYSAMVYRLTPTSVFEDWAIGVLAAVDDVDQTSQADLTYKALKSAFLATGILAESSGAAPGYLTGMVTDSSTGKPIAGAQVELRSSPPLTTTTDSRGIYILRLPSSILGTTSLMVIDAVGYYGSTLSASLIGLEGATAGQLQKDVPLKATPAPTLAYALNQSTVSIAANSSSSAVQLTVRNAATSSESELGWQVWPSVEYTIQEQPYSWQDVPADPTLLIDVTGDQEHSAEQSVGFGFPYYFQEYRSYWLSTDGYLTLTEDPTLYYRELPLPSQDAPRAMIAALWADLVFEQPCAYFKPEPSRGELWVELVDVPDYDGLQQYTFQTGLFSDGRIRFSYSEVTGPPSSWARAGIQNEAGTEGLELAVSSPSKPSSMLVAGKTYDLVPSFPPRPGSVSLSSSSGLLQGGQAVTLPVSISTQGLSSGSYAVDLKLRGHQSSQPVSLRVYVQVP